jgi:hypothetical protein
MCANHCKPEMNAYFGDHDLEHNLLSALTSLDQIKNSIAWSWALICMAPKSDAFPPQIHECTDQRTFSNIQCSPLDPRTAGGFSRVNIRLPSTLILNQLAEM